MSNWKDTVMNDNQIVKITNDWVFSNESVKPLIEAQAEISFEAGVRKGIREVVEWIEETFHRYAVNRPFEEEWQAKLKEWGILLPSPELTGEDR